MEGHQGDEAVHHIRSRITYMRDMIKGTHKMLARDECVSSGVGNSCEKPAGASSMAVPMGLGLG